MMQTMSIILTSCEGVDLGVQSTVVLQGELHMAGLPRNVLGGAGLSSILRD